MSTSGRNPGPERCVLIGTERTLRPLAREMALIDGAPDPLGAILVIGPHEDRERRPDRLPEIGLDVLGGLDALAEIVSRDRPDAAVVSLPMGMPGTIFEVRRLLRSLGVEERFVPWLEELLRSRAAPARSASAPHVEVSPARPLAPSPTTSFATLIEREPHTIDQELVRAALCGKRVLVTGAGGSIGSELARLAARFDPRELILVERSENALFEIDRQIERLHPETPRRAVLHDIVEQRATRARFGMVRPDVVFHAAAHKHVPLMEDHPIDAVRNNVFGTVSVAEASIESGAERVVLISSDKAVHPTSVMGATKRLAECCILALHDRCVTMNEFPTRFAMVRFGNVLGSAGSVIPVWSAQIAEGGPVTVTDSRMTRYFMTIGEAAALVIQAAAMPPDQPGAAPLYVLDMGEPVRILDLAKRFVRAHGFEPRVCKNRDAEPDEQTPGVMPIVFTGARPGEKLHEELAYDTEQLAPTDHPGIHAWRASGARSDPTAMNDLLRDLEHATRGQDRDTLLAAIRRHVPEMGDPASQTKRLRRAG